MPRRQILSGQERDNLLALTGKPTRFDPAVCIQRI